MKWFALDSGLIVLLCAAVFWPVHAYDFVDFDDNLYVTGNDIVLKGFGATPLSDAFANFSQPIYVPLVELSFMAEVEAFGVRPGVFHVTNAVLHTLNAMLFYALAFAITRRRYAGLVAAALFAAHPMHVESVAWISGRKDVLSMLFWLLGTLAYLRYTRAEQLGPYFTTLIMFVAGLLAKPILVVFPFTLLLFDFGPLSRRRPSATVNRLIMEKVPLFAIAAAFSFAAWATQRHAGAVSAMDAIPLLWRLQNAVWAYAAYVVKLLVPFGLSAFYPHPLGDLSAFDTTLACALVGLSLLWCIRVRDEHRWASFAWLWMAGTLVPVIGIVQIGAQSYADRYTYVAYLGPFLAVAALLARRLDSGNTSRTLHAVVGIAIVSFSLISHRQVLTWQNSITVFEQALRVDPTNTFAHLKLGWALRDSDPVRAIAHHEAAAALQPRNPRIYAQLGRVYSGTGDHDGAVRAFWTRLSITPADPMAFEDLATAYRLRGDSQSADAIADCVTALSDPNLAWKDSVRSAARHFRGRGLTGEADFLDSLAGNSSSPLPEI